jgi:hypothetical protein
MIKPFQNWFSSIRGKNWGVCQNIHYINLQATTAQRSAFLLFVSRFWSLFLVPRTTVSCLHCCTTKYVSHHWSTPHCCSPTYTIHSYIQYQLSSILQFFLHMRCFHTTTVWHYVERSYTQPRWVTIWLRVTWDAVHSVSCEPRCQADI